MCRVTLPYDCAVQWIRAQRGANSSARARSPSCSKTLTHSWQASTSRVCDILEQGLQVRIGAYELPSTEPMPVYASEERPLFLRPPDAVFAWHSSPAVSLMSTGVSKTSQVITRAALSCALEWGFPGGQLLPASVQKQALLGPSTTASASDGKGGGPCSDTTLDQKGMRLLQLTRHIRSRHCVQPFACAQPKPDLPAAVQRVPAFAISRYRPESAHDENLEIPIAQRPSEQHHHAHYKRRRVQLTPYYCPCCIQPCLTPAKLGVHIQKCCPDLFNAQASRLHSTAVAGHFGLHRSHRACISWA